MSAIRLISIKDIVLSGNNPRKTFSENGLNQLAKSIKGVGLISPITVRPIEDGKYELIAGERRYKACKVARVKDIKAHIVEADDQTAFRMMIIENLQREDVHPIEEAAGFADMIEEYGMTIAECAESMGQSPSFIAKRMKLNSMIDPLKKAFYDGHMSLQTALAIARVDEDSQKDIFEKNYKEEGWQGYPQHKSILSYIERHVKHNLEKAPFEKDDKALLTWAGACIDCPKRSGANPLLFDEETDEDICYDSSCYEEKCNQQFLRDLEMALNSDDIILMDGSFNKEVSEEISETAKVYEKKIYTEEDIRFGITESESDNFDEVIAFYVNSYEKGTYKKVYLPKGTIEKANKEPDPVEQIKEKIQKAEEREDRKVELDREKIFRELPELWEDYDFDSIPLVDEPVDEKILLIAQWHLLLDQLPYGFKKEAMHYHDPKLKDPTELGFIRTNYDQKAQWWMQRIFDLSRRYVIHNLFSSSMQDKNKFETAFIYEDLTSRWHKDRYNQIVDEQMEKREERKAKYDEKIKTLKSKIDNV